jgi:hypothetical protein
MSSMLMPLEIQRPSVERMYASRRDEDGLWASAGAGVRC